MVINEMKLKVRDLIQGYNEDDATNRVVAWGGKLDVRPEYQREFVYDDDKRNAVINTVLNGFPLNIMYFVDRQDGTYEVLDGQQRIISICRYACNGFSVRIPNASGKFDTVNFPNLFQQNRDNFLNYELTVYVCQGTDKEKLDWFQVINIAGAVLTKQEIRNALYHGSWLTDAKSAFSRRNCAAYRNYGKYMKGDCIRQDYLETVFNWKAADEGFTGKDAVVEFMQAHRYDADANDLWAYFEAVFDWVKHVFGSIPDKSMQGVAWGLLYNKHRHDNLDPAWMQQQVRELMSNEEVVKKSGIYQYLLEGDEKCLQPRQFDKSTAMTMYEKQCHRCAMCGEEKDFKDMHADHIVPWSKGGKTEISNCQMLCIPCNEKKGNH